MWPSRRCWLGLGPAVLAGTAQAVKAAVSERSPVLASDARRFVDEATENVVLRLTDPSYSSHLPPIAARPFFQRGSGLLYASDRTGTWQAFRLDAKSGQSRQLTRAEALLPGSVAVSPDERSLFLIDGDALQQWTVASQKVRVLERRDAGWASRGPVAVSDDGNSVAVLDTRPGYARVRLLPVRFGTAVNVLQSDSDVHDVAFRPRSTTLSCRRGDGRMLLLTRGRAPEVIGPPEGKCGASVWTADGAALLYLHTPPQGGTVLREYAVDTREDRQISRTSQFVQFARNTDATVFAGLSGSRGAPYVLLLVRRGRRELTLCEHRAADPSAEQILFSPSSQRVYFESDRFGKPALLAMAVDKLVDKTDDES